METIFDLANIAAGIILAASTLMKIQSISDSIVKLSNWLRGFKVTIGAVALILGIIYLLRPGCALYDLTGILAGLVLLTDTLINVPGVGESLTKLSRTLLPFTTTIGIAALIVGILGLLDLNVLC
jgi:cadmium resistance protein CadD (predicted permease)